MTTQVIRWVRNICEPPGHIEMMVCDDMLWIHLHRGELDYSEQWGTVAHHQ